MNILLTPVAAILLGAFVRPRATAVALYLGIEAAPVRELPCHLLIVIENDDAHAPPRLL